LRIRHLRFLELVAEHGSLTTAAAQLALSQPAATKMLQELESAFGVELVARTTRGAALSLRTGCAGPPAYRAQRAGGGGSVNDGNTARSRGEAWRTPAGWRGDPAEIAGGNGCAARLPKTRRA
jgi:hypothetical protein